MLIRAIHYSFVQEFKVSARRAFEWCTDYAPSDMTLVNEENATREVQRVSSDSVILVDTFVVAGKPVVKQKLVCLYPDRLMWTSTHLTGPNKYSQFLYEIASKSDEQSCLTFTALPLDYDVKTDEEAERLAKKLKLTNSEN
jgi:hypothetical protein